jgi:prolyl-tRNA editing enzyme YbaK/EbsC (Cys-tRNA(Pro) deacylase)
MHERAAEFSRRAQAEHGLDIEIREFTDGTATAADAAEAIGCDLGAIASSIALVADELVVVVTSGANRVDTGKLAALRGVQEARTADPDEIGATLGWSIGGVPPFCHETDVPVYLDETLTGYDTVWAAAGTPEAVFPVAPERIVDCADATVADVAG